MSKLLSYASTLFASVYSVVSIQNVQMNIRAQKNKIINDIINDSVENTYVDYVKPLKDNNQWTNDKHIIALNKSQEYFYIRHSQYLGLFDKPVEKERVNRLIKDRLNFIKK